MQERSAQPGSINCGPSKISRPIRSQGLVVLPMLRASNRVINRNIGVSPYATAEVPNARWSALLGVTDSPCHFVRLRTCQRIPGERYCKERKKRQEAPKHCKPC